jgi:ATP-dependent DNA helicase RecQ
MSAVRPVLSEPAPRVGAVTTADPISDLSALREQAERLLRALAGPAAQLRDDQWSAVRALVVDRRRALVVQRTGWGKSAVYFVATALLRARGAGPTLIVSPLLALMRNQIAAADRAGVRAHTINSSNAEEWRAVEEELRADAVDVLLISPERLNNPDFRDRVLPGLAARVGLLVVDEAHCISDWGHDFRPDYRRIRDVLARLPPGVPVLGTTATANGRVVDDVAEQLAGAGQPFVQRGSLDRESLRLGVIDLRTAERRLGWLAEHLGTLPGSGIVYTLTVSAAAETARFLRECGYAVAAYSGQADTAERLEAEGALLANEVKALVSTSALGMGFDKPDLGFVLHVGAPQSPIAYYQQVGRAGRGVAAADALLLPGPEDEAIWRYFASLAFPSEQQVRATLTALADSASPLSTAALEARVDLRRTRLETMLKVLDVDGAVRRVPGGWVATGQEWAYDGERYARVAAARAAEQQAMRDYLTTRQCRLEFLRRALDDPYAEPCGRCDTCAGARHPSAVDPVYQRRAGRDLGRVGVEVEPRKLWPSGMAALGVELGGRIPAGEAGLAGRAVARLTDPGWGSRLRGLLGPGAPDGAVPADVLDASVDVLRAWPWESRPGAVVAMPSRTRPLLVRSVAERLAEIGRLPFLGSLTYAGAGPAGGPGGNSAFRLSAVHGRITVPAEVAGALPGGAPVLLVDDLADSRWTLTVATRALRLAGAAGVLPFVLAVEA